MQSKQAKFRHAHDAYWDAVERALVEQYHRDEESAQEWMLDKQEALEDEAGQEFVPNTPPDRMAQEIFMERAQ